MEPKVHIPAAQKLYGRIVYWITILSAILCMIGPVIAMAWPDRNALNPHFLFAEIFAGKSYDEIWDKGGNGFPGGHFYGQSVALEPDATASERCPGWSLGDGLTQFGLALGCSVALWALIITAFAYLRQKIYIYAFLALWVAFLVALSATGIVANKH